MALVLALGFLSLFLVVASAPAAPITVTIPFSPVPVSNADLDGNPATGAWSDASNWTIPLENGASAPYGSAQLYAKHDNSSVYFRIDGHVDIPWQSATGTHFWLGMQISPSGTSHHSSGTWEGAFFGLWDGGSYTPTPTYPPAVVETTGFGRPPTQNATDADYGFMGVGGTAAPYNVTAEWKRPLNAGGLALLPDGTTSYHFFVTTETSSAGANGGNINHGSITNVNVMRLASAGGGGTPTPPSVSITSPTSNAVVNGVVVVAATASSSAGIAHVDFYADTTLLGTATSAPYTATWDTTGYANGAHTLTAKAYDPASNLGTSTISVRVDHTARALAITAPANRSVVTGLVTINVSATDPGGVDSVDVFVNGTLLGSVTEPPYSLGWDTTSSPEGFYTIRAMASFTTGGARNATVHVLVDRMPAVAAPTVTDAGEGSLQVTWTASSDAFVAGYILLRSGASAGPFVQLNANPLRNTTYVDVGLTPGGTYYYEVVAVDIWGHPSPSSAPAGGVAGAASLFDLQNLRWAALPAGMALVLILLAALVRRELRRRGQPTRSRDDADSNREEGR
ncbi:MAG TPA: Ig-like domain-containing protein [Thermoplasmata archaeon]|nr:Ig-like domain-containing protein [Thermoplasmata archaeon]